MICNRFEVVREVSLVSVSHSDLIRVLCNTCTDLETCPGWSSDAYDAAVQTRAAEGSKAVAASHKVDAGAVGGA